MSMSRIISQSFIPARTKTGEALVSTVCLGIPHVGGMFETMVFRARNGRVKSWLDLDCKRYETAWEARQGHAAMVERWGKVQAKRVPPPAPPTRIVVVGERKPAPIDE